MMKRILILIFFCVSSCGYKPLYSNKNSNTYTFNELELVGDKDINRRIISAMSIKENKQNYNYQKITLKNNKKIIATSRDTKGQPDSYKMTVSLNIMITNDGKTLENRKIIEEFSYKNLDNKFDLSEYEINVKNNLTDRIIEELIIYLNL